MPVRLRCESAPTTSRTSVQEGQGRIERIVRAALLSAVTDRSPLRHSYQMNNRSRPCTLGRGCRHTAGHRGVVRSTQVRNRPPRRNTIRLRPCPTENSRRVPPHSPSSRHMPPNSDRSGRQQTAYTKPRPRRIQYCCHSQQLRVDNRSTVLHNSHPRRQCRRHRASGTYLMRCDTRAHRRGSRRPRKDETNGRHSSRTA